MAIKLSELQVGEIAIIQGFHSGSENQKNVLTQDVMRRLMEMGVIVGSKVIVMHEAPISKDPIAIEVRGVLIGIRRSEAACIIVEKNHAN